MTRLTALALAFAGMAGSANTSAAQERSYDLPAFHAVEIGTGIRASIEISENRSVVATASRQELLDDVTMDVENGTLKIRFDSNLFDFILKGGIVGALINGRPDLTVAISAPRIEAVTVRSGAVLAADGVSGDRLAARFESGAEGTFTNLAVGELSARAESGARVSATGSCAQMAVDVASGGTADLSRMACATADITAETGARISVLARETITGHASLGGRIIVYGDPDERTVDTSLGGTVSFED
ncbi:hypothetical protein GCM10007989_06480 [Devosia pacifica]|uniref:Putative auto-transporter adhesin head GIN domain-containing protein n=1 Tax=Devosia pacifica TaxID=1335967 RepID=A0A918VPZ4_9HYPH|nr:DUF2807 domain-containing protein [Devosia pacifica]GHA14490.1 hypothetical protein GCM10007989_06480 [Devosia pacifica]